ncbi:MAG TPA: hypothetical protein VIK55_01595 [Paludibacter sp.]
MAGILEDSIKREFEDSFENNCLTLFGEAYKYIRENSDITIDWDEENISANFFNYIDKSEKAIGLNINISDECRLYYDIILKGKIPAKKAPRIDFRLTTNWLEEKKRLEYFVEAKNLIESDCYKSGRKAKISAQEKHERYINTGIDNFISGRYPQKGCIVGYVLQGEPNKIVNKINAYLQQCNRTSEYLYSMESTIQNLEFCYQSSHENEIRIKHFLLKFSA